LAFQRFYSAVDWLTISARGKRAVKKFRIFVGASKSWRKERVTIGVTVAGATLEIKRRATLGFVRAA